MREYLERRNDNLNTESYISFVVDKKVLDSYFKFSVNSNNPSGNNEEQSDLRFNFDLLVLVVTVRNCFRCVQIDVSDGFSNGAVCKLVHIELNEVK